MFFPFSIFTSSEYQNAGSQQKSSQNTQSCHHFKRSGFSCLRASRSVSSLISTAVRRITSGSITSISGTSVISTANNSYRRICRNLCQLWTSSIWTWSWGCFWNGCRRWHRRIGRLRCNGRFWIFDGFGVGIGVGLGFSAGFT